MKKALHSVISCIVFLTFWFCVLACSPYGTAFNRATAGAQDGAPYYRGIPGGNDIGGNGFPTYDYDFPIRGPRR